MNSIRCRRFNVFTFGNEMDANNFVSLFFFFNLVSGAFHIWKMKRTKKKKREIICNKEHLTPGPNNAAPLCVCVYLLL